MSRVRSIDTLNDWTFGKGRNDYKTGQTAVAQNIKTRLQSFLGDCFFSLESGLDWFNYNGSKNQLELRLAVTSIILNTNEVVSVREILISLSESRNFLLTYEVQTVYGTLRQTVEQISEL